MNDKKVKVVMGKFKSINFVCSGCEGICGIPCSVQMQAGIHADPSRCVVNGDVVDWRDKMKVPDPRSFCIGCDNEHADTDTVPCCECDDMGNKRTANAALERKAAATDDSDQAIYDRYLKREGLVKKDDLRSALVARAEQAGLQFKARLEGDPVCECGHPIKEHYSADRMYANCFHVFDDGKRCTCNEFKAKGGL